MKRASATRAGLSPVVAQGRACPRDASNRLPVGLHLLRRAPGHRRRRHPGDAERQRQGHGPVSRTLRRYPGPGCARRHDVRRRRLARRARPHRSPTTSPWRCCSLTVPNSTPSSGFGSTYANASYRSASSTTPRPSSTLLPSMDRPHRRTGSYANPLRLSMNHEGDFIGSLVLYQGSVIKAPRDRVRFSAVRQGSRGRCSASASLPDALRR